VNEEGILARPYASPGQLIDREFGGFLAGCNSEPGFSGCEQLTQIHFTPLAADGNGADLSRGALTRNVELLACFDSDRWAESSKPNIPDAATIVGLRRPSPTYGAQA